MMKQEPQRIYRELDVCLKCKRVDSFRPYKWRRRIIYARCECGQKAVIASVVKLRGVAKIAAEK